ncbi:MAG: hypothetical protein ACYC8T_06775 [Myxococcaceae bacterium]
MEQGLGENAVRGLRFLALCLAVLAFAFLAIRLALLAPFTLDEFQYAHASWLVSKGSVPYRDFFEVHLPLVYQWLAPLWRLLGDDPAGVVWLRVGLLPFLLLTLVAAASVNRREGALASVLSPVLLIACPPFIAFATQLRPDPVAFALFLGALGLHYARRPGPLARGFLSGALLVLAVWSSQKVLFYGAPLLLGLRPAPRANSPEGSSAPSALGMGLGALAASVPLAGYLTVTGSFGALWHWCFAWAAEHQRGYPGFSSWRYLGPALAQVPWLFALGALGAAGTVRRLAGLGPARWRDPDLLLLTALPATFGSFALQQAPYPYSLLPFLGITAVFAARGVAEALRLLRPLRLELAGALAIALLLSFQAVQLFKLPAETNAPQLEVLSRIGRLTAPGDVVYDNSGGFVSRPHASFYFYTDAFLRSSRADELAREVPKALVEKECVLRLEDVRSDTLPPPLRDFLARHYQPLDGDLHLWGQRFEGAGEGRFLAVKTGRYFVEPAGALAGGALELDGRPVTAPVFELPKGEHLLRSRAAEPFYLLWLPRDGQRWVPKPGSAPSYSRLF